MTVIPEKLYFKIGEVSKITRVKPYVLRYWENEFKIISPRKSQGRQRVYSRSDVELIIYIKKLIRTEKLTLEGAKKKARDFRKDTGDGKKQMNFPFGDKKYQSTLKSIRKDLNSIKKILRSSLD
jgi:DNA-binding transcriptional MerR regulator